MSSNILASLGSLLMGVSVYERTKDALWLAVAIVVGFLAWRIFIEALKSKKNGDNKLHR